MNQGQQTEYRYTFTKIQKNSSRIRIPGVKKHRIPDPDLQHDPVYTVWIWSRDQKGQSHKTVSKIHTLNDRLGPNSKLRFADSF
jgi:hypothetical protein